MLCNPCRCGITPISGARGVQGLPGAGAIIPYASGTPAIVTTVLSGLLGTTSLIGFGSSATGVSIAGGVIDLQELEETS